MAVSTELPNELQPCETCGHEPDRAKRYAWLAGCPDGHVFHLWFDINWLANTLVHEWPDRTYSALRMVEGALDDQTALAWLDAAHAGLTARRPAFTGERLVVDEMIEDRQQDAVTGDITVTWRLPTVEGI